MLIYIILGLQLMVFLSLNIVLIYETYTLFTVPVCNDGPV